MGQPVAKVDRPRPDRTQGMRPWRGSVYRTHFAIFIRCFTDILQFDTLQGSSEASIRSFVPPCFVRLASPHSYGGHLSLLGDRRRRRHRIGPASCVAGNCGRSAAWCSKPQQADARRRSRPVENEPPNRSEVSHKPTAAVGVDGSQSRGIQAPR